MIKTARCKTLLGLEGCGLGNGHGLVYVAMAKASHGRSRPNSNSSICSALPTVSLMAHSTVSERCML